MKSKSLILGILILVSSCSGFYRTAINASSNLLYKASASVEGEGNLDMARLSIPGNLLLIEGLLAESPNNDEILAILIKGYAGYAFAINETDLLSDQLENKSDEINKKSALLNYTKAFNFGRRYLKQRNIDWKVFEDRVFTEQKGEAYLGQFLSSSKIDLEVVLFTAHALASMINLQKDDIGVIAKLPIAKTMFDWVCSKDSTINFGTCDIFMASYEAGRPKMLGGNPEKGKEIFVRAMEKYPHNWLIRLSYIQYYLIPQGDEEGFKKEMEVLSQKNIEFYKQQIYSVNDGSPAWALESRLRLYQSLALKRYQIIEKNKKNLF